MELSPLAGNRALKTQLSQQEEGRGLRSEEHTSELQHQD